MSEFMRRIWKLQALTLRPDTHNGENYLILRQTSLIKLRFNAVKINHSWRFVTWDIMHCRWQLLIHVSNNNSASIFRVMHSKTRCRAGRHGWQRAMVDCHIFRLGYISWTGWTRRLLINVGKIYQSTWCNTHKIWIFSNSAVRTSKYRRLRP